MHIDIGAYDPETRTVPATFTAAIGDETIVHERSVNAQLDADGGYDEAATRALIEDQLALGVSRKMQLGVIANALPTPELPDQDAGAEPEA